MYRVHLATGQRDLSNADDRVADVLRKLVADRLADFDVGPADQVVGGREPAEVVHSLQVPDDDAWLHENYLWALAH